MRRYFGLLAAGLVTCGAQGGGLAPPEVLVVFDSRIPDSVLVAEHYAGSSKVPGGVGGVPAARPGVRVLDLATRGAPQPNAPQLSYNAFTERLRDPIAGYLRDEGLTRGVRCIVLTKGISHRVLDTDAGTIGDNPGGAANQFIAGDATYASVDSELTLLFQDLNATEAGGNGDSPADGVILNPYARRTQPIAAFSTEGIDEPLTFSAIGPPGQYWIGTFGSLNPGRMMLVTRLDGSSVDDVRGMIDRARDIYLDPQQVAIVLDESGSNGVADAAPNSELDNVDGRGRFGDDFELTRDTLLADGRWAPSLVRYDPSSGQDAFLVGPRLPFDGEGALVTEQVALLAHYGDNHAGSQPGGVNDPEAGPLYAESFFYAPGAVFNTFESFNARALNGLGGSGQEQAADFIAAGGTLAIGHVWEPFALFVADNHLLTQSFFLGEQTWAEAAWSSIAVLSWQHVVFGDPLARVRRASEDVNGDGRVDIDDMHDWDPVAGPDINRDGVVDTRDRDLIERAIRFGEQYGDRATAVRPKR